MEQADTTTRNLHIKQLLRFIAYTGLTAAIYGLMKLLATLFAKRMPDAPVA